MRKQRRANGADRKLGRPPNGLQDHLPTATLFDLSGSVNDRNVPESVI